MTQDMQHYQASKFNDCIQGKCYCDKPCPMVRCQSPFNCGNNATDISSLDNFTPMCDECKERTKIKFDKFMAKNRGF